MCVFLKNLFLNEINKIDERVSLNLVILIVGSCLTIDRDWCLSIIKVVGNDTSSTVGKIWWRELSGVSRNARSFLRKVKSIDTHYFQRNNLIRRLRYVRLKVKIPVNHHKQISTSISRFSISCNYTPKNVNTLRTRIKPLATFLPRDLSSLVSPTSLRLARKRSGSNSKSKRNQVVSLVTFSEPQ